MGTASFRAWTLTACLFGGTLAGCTKTGLAWVNEPESGVDLEPPSPRSASESIPRPADPTSTARPSAQVAAPATAGRPRLDRSITLGGESGFATPADHASGAPSSGPANVVNVYVMSMSPSSNFVYGPSYGAGFYSRGSGFFPAASAGVVRTPAPAALRPGLDWPSVPNYGPAFPYRMGPASPWEAGDPRRR